MNEVNFTIFNVRNSFFDFKLRIITNNVLLLLTVCTKIAKMISSHRIQWTTINALRQHDLLQQLQRPRQLRNRTNHLRHQHLAPFPILQDILNISNLNLRSLRYTPANPNRCMTTKMADIITNIFSTTERGIIISRQLLINYSAIRVSVQPLSSRLRCIRLGLARPRAHKSSITNRRQWRHCSTRHPPLFRLC